MKPTLTVDARKRVTLPVNASVRPGDDLEIEILEDGRMVLTPIVRIPKHQMWAWTERVDRLLVEAASNPRPKVRVTAPGVLEELAKANGVKF